MGESHVNEPGSWYVIYLCAQSSSINREFVNSLDQRRNKQISWKEDGNKLIIPLSSVLANKKTSVCWHFSDGNANLLVKAEKVVKGAQTY